MCLVEARRLEAWYKGHWLLGLHAHKGLPKGRERRLSQCVMVPNLRNIDCVFITMGNGLGCLIKEHKYVYVMTKLSTKKCLTHVPLSFLDLI